MKKKLLGILLSTAMIATMLVGCGSSAADTTAPADSSTEESTDASADASADATWIAGVTSGTQLTSTGVCDNGWIEVSYEGQTAYVSGDYVSAVAADGAAADGTADQAATEGSADAAADEAVAG